MESRMTGCGHRHDAASRRLQVRLPLRAQVGENGEHAAVILGRGGQAKLREDARHVLLDGAVGDDELLGDPGVGAALGHEAEDLTLPRRELVDRIVPPPPPDELRDDRRVEGRPALAHTADRVCELVHVRYAVLEQIADAFGALGEKLHRVRRLYVLREDEHAAGGVLLADLLGGAEALVGMGRRHADVHDGHVRGVAADLEHELVRVPGLADDLEPGLVEDARDALAKENGVLCQDYPHGISARIRVPCPGALSTCRRPSRASTRSARPRRPEPFSGSAPPTPSSATSTTALPFRRITRTPTADACAYLATLASASETT